MGRRFAEFAQACLTGAEIVVGEAHADIAKACGEIDQARGFGHRGLMDLDHQIQFWLVAAQMDQRGEELPAERFFRMRVGKQGKARQAWCNLRQAEAAEGDAELDFAIECGGQREEAKSAPMAVAGDWRDRAIRRRRSSC